MIKAKEGTILSEGLQYHLKTQTPLNENIYRPGSNTFYHLFNEARNLLQEGKIEVEGVDKFLLETDLGLFGEYNGIRVPLDYPLTEEYILKEAEYQGKSVTLNTPHRNPSGKKKFVVFVKNSKTGKVKKIQFGDAHGGLSVKIKDPKARKAFSARHNCPMKKDKTTAGFWSCRIPHYAKSLNLSSNIAGYW